MYTAHDSGCFSIGKRHPIRPIPKGSAIDRIELIIVLRDNEAMTSGKHDRLRFQAIFVVTMISFILSLFCAPSSDRTRGFNARESFRRIFFGMESMFFRCSIRVGRLFRSRCQTNNGILEHNVSIKQPMAEPLSSLQTKTTRFLNL
jgi:hypothetical protein